MKDIWNPWHGCIKYSEGCDHCYMYYLDKVRDQDGQNIYKTKTKFRYPLAKDRYGHYKIKSGETVRVCMTSDFFLEEADEWRDEAWEIIKIRSDVKFLLITKRPERVRRCLPKDWNDGWENVFFNVTAENQKRADERIPILLDLPFKHKGVMCAPMLTYIDIDKYLGSDQIEQVSCGGENYDGRRPCDFNWVKSLRNQCQKYNITFCFIETGTNFIKDGKSYYLPKKQLQSEMAFKSKMNFIGKPMEFKLINHYGEILQKEDLYIPQYKESCNKCASKITCNGCSNCGKC